MKATELADYSVRTVWHVQDRGRKVHLVDLVRGRIEYPDLVAAAVALWRKWKVDWAHNYLVIEDKGSGVESDPISEKRADLRSSAPRQARGR